jgi:hypothetical protein
MRRQSLGAMRFGSGESAVILSAMKLTLFLLSIGLVLLLDGCAFGPTLDQQSREQTQQQQTEKQSDAFARSLQP